MRSTSHSTPRQLDTTEPFDDCPASSVFRRTHRREVTMNGVVGILVLLIELAICIVIVAGYWKMFAKANEPGWAAIVPIYNVIVMLKICGKPIWWIVLFLIPIVNAVVGIMLCLSLAKSFGKSTGFAVGLILLSPIFVPILGFGDSKYAGPAG